jgi:hypothetical protein
MPNAFAPAQTDLRLRPSVFAGGLGMGLTVISDHYRFFLKAK